MAPKKYFNYRKNQPWTEHLQIVAQLGLTMAGSILFCLFIGRVADNWLETKGIFTALFILLGIIGGGVVVYRQIMEIMEPAANGEKETGRDAKKDRDNGSV
ncbi:MAG: AtpZ/AtpI family protein [Thermodesulfobacteriota bacterium]